MARGVEFGQPAVISAIDVISRANIIDISACKSLGLFGVKDGSISLEMIVPWLLGHAKANGIRKSLVALERFFALDNVRAKRMVSIWGVRPKAPISLNDHTVLTDPKLLPISEKRDEILHISPWKQVQSAPHFPPICTAVISCDIEIPIVINGHINAEPEHYVSPYYLAQFLTLFSDRNVTILADWIELPIGVPLFGGIQQSSTFFYDGSCVFDIEAADADLSSLDFLVMNWLSSDQPLRQVVDLALRRLNSSKMSGEVSAAFIDLAIALEALVLESGDRDNITSKLATRLARYLGSDLTERRGIYKRVKQFYETRSKYVHGRVMDADPTGRREAKEAESLSLMQIYCNNLIKRVVRNQKLPNWEDVILA